MTDTPELAVTIIQDESLTLWMLADHLGVGFKIHGWPGGQYRVRLEKTDFRDDGMVGTACGSGPTLQAAMESLAEAVNRYRRLVVDVFGSEPREVIVKGLVRAQSW